MVILPKNKLGKWSVGLIVAMPILFVLGTTTMSLLYGSAPAGNSIADDLLHRPALAISMLLGMGCGISAMITGLIAILKEREKSLLVYLATFLGGLLLIFLLGEVIFPH